MEELPRHVSKLIFLFSVLARRTHNNNFFFLPACCCAPYQPYTNPRAAKMKPSHVLIVLWWPAARAFLASYPRSGCLSPALASVPDSTTTTTTTSLEDLRARSVRELKTELESLNISTKDALEKEDLVQRLYQALQSPSTTAAPTKTDPNVLTTPLLLSSLEHDVPVRAQAFPDKEDWKLRPSEQPYCAIRVRVQEQWSTPITLTLLLDTACSGILLKPAVVERHGLAVVTSPVTMTSGGGTASSNSQVTTLSKLSLENCPERTFGSLPAVVQDIGALPQALDGIIGLSFLSQFDTLELNFVNSTVSLYDTEPAAPPAHTVRLGPKAPLHRLGSLGIYAVDTWWGGRGPVRMLVDTGVRIALSI